MPTPRDIHVSNSMSTRVLETHKSNRERERERERESERERERD